MKLISPSVKIEFPVSEVEIFKKVELAGRTCYKSEGKITDDSCLSFFKMILNKKHLSVLEHVSITARFICSRAMTHELVRHRLASHSMESQRYCRYNTNDIQFIMPIWFGLEGNEKDMLWSDAMEYAEQKYIELLDAGQSAQDARDVLPNATKTEIVVTANLREWIHILKLRTAPEAHPEMRRLMKLFLDELSRYYPNLTRLLSEHI